MRIVIKSASIILSLMVITLITTVVAAASTISVDGYYDDWQDKPNTSVFYDAACTHSVSMFLDNGYLYGHIKMSDLAGKYYPTSLINLNINDQYDVLFNINFNQTSGNIYNLPVGRNLNLAPFKKTTVLGDAAITVYDTGHMQGDEVEFRIDLKTIAQYCNNMAVDEMQNITLNCPNLGDQVITITATSTAPYMGIAIVIAALGLIFLFQRKKAAGKVI